jgi:hypothetical protein
VSLYVPPQQLVDAYLEEIARGYGLAWRAPVTASPEEKGTELAGNANGKDGDGNDDDGPGGGVGVKVGFCFHDHRRMLCLFPPLCQEGDGKTAITPAAIAEPAETSAKMSKIITEDDQARELLQKVSSAEASRKVVEHKELDEYDALAARFEALKKR